MNRRIFNVYVAGSSSPREKLRVRNAMDLVIEHPRMHLTLDWQEIIEKAGAANEGLSYDERISAATADLDGVRRADILWLLAPHADIATGRGCWVELGAGLVLEKVVVISGKDRGRSIFCALGQEIATDEDAFAVICALLDEYPWAQEKHA